MSQLRIELYSICWNAERILPYFLRHYEPICNRLVFYDNMSTDSTREIIGSSVKSTLRDFDTGGQIDETNYLRVKNEAYKESRGAADYVIVVDIDEFVYHPDVMTVLAEYRSEGVTLPKIRGFNMTSLFHPREPGVLTDLVRRGRYSPQYSKRCVFSPELDIHYLPGAHRCEPVGHVVQSKTADLTLRHYHYIGMQTVLSRYRMYQNRLCDGPNMKEHWVQYRSGQIYTAARFLKNWLLARKVLP